MKNVNQKVNPPQESEIQKKSQSNIPDPHDNQDKYDQLEKDQMTFEGGLPEASSKPRIPSKLHFEHKYKSSTPRQFLTRILMREDIYEKFHWY